MDLRTFQFAGGLHFRGRSALSVRGSGPPWSRFEPERHPRLAWTLLLRLVERGAIQGQPPAMSQEDDRVTARITTSRESHEAGPSRQGKPPCQFRDLRDGPAIRCRVRQEKDAAAQPEVALLSTDPPLKGLDVVEARFGLDEGPEIRTCDHDVGATEVALDGDRDLGAPTERW